MSPADSALTFSSSARAVGDEDELTLTSVGIDIGSSTTHLVFSRLRLERHGASYVVAERTVVYESAIALTPFDPLDRARIDGAALGEFLERQYALSGLQRSEVDTGALILTGLAVRRENARQIGELFADEAGKFVMVTAGDGLEATMAAHGSGSAARSAEVGPCVNVDIGGGTTKLAFCAQGRVIAVTALDVGARLLVLDADRRLIRIEPAAQYLADALAIDLVTGEAISEKSLQALVSAMADMIWASATRQPSIVDASVITTLLRIPELPAVASSVESVIFSGGVSEYVYGRETAGFGDIGALLAAAVRERFERAGIRVIAAGSGIRATAMGASQYTVQVSGSTIFVDPVSVLPLQSVPVLSLELELDSSVIDAGAVTAAVKSALARTSSPATADRAVAIAVKWGGSATYPRLEALTSGIIEGLQAGAVDASGLAAEVPVIIVTEGDIGGLIGMHIRDAGRLPNPVVSIDGIQLRDFDYIDIGALIPTSGAVPVVIKSLVFPVPGQL